MKNFVVYKHTSPNGKVYIGITKQNPLYRWDNGMGYSGQPKFFRAIVKYGWDNIKHEILFTDLTEEEACAKEKELIQFYDSAKSGYNASTGGKCTHEGAIKYHVGDIVDGFKIVDRYEKKVALECLDCGAIIERSISTVSNGRLKCFCKRKYSIGTIIGNFEIIGKEERRYIVKCLDCGAIIKRQSGSLQHNSILCKCKTKPKPEPRERVYITHNGKTQTLQEWSKELNIPETTIRTRYKNGRPIDEVKRAPYKTIKCEHCGKEFQQRQKDQKYCSKECQWQSIKVERPTMICEQCGKEFKAKRATNKDYQARFCSHECQINSMRKVV